MRSKTWMLVAMASAAAMATWLAFSYRVPEKFLARYWHTNLATLSDRQIEIRLRQAGELDEEGLSVLVEALAGSRPALYEPAGRILHRQLDRWQSLPIGESTQKTTALAGHLARNVQRFSDPALETAAALAQRILRWPVDPDQRAPLALVVDCEQVVRHWASENNQSARTPHQPAQSILSQTLGGDSPESDLIGSPADRELATSLLEVDPSELPGGNLPVGIVEMPPLPPSLAGPPAPRPVPEQPQLVPPSLRQLPRPLFPDEDNQSMSEPSGSRVDEPAFLESTSPVPRRLDSSEPEAVRPFVPARPTIGVRALTSAADLELVHHLANVDTSIRDEATLELQRRGFDRFELELAERLNHPDPAVRRRLVAVLDQLPVSGTRWLVWLSHDSDPYVRRDAVVRMATSQDTKVFERLYEMQKTEPYPLVRKQIDRWAQQTSQSSRLR